MFKKLHMLISIFIISLFAFTNIASASHIKAAILPPINSAKYPDNEIQEVIKQKTLNYFRFPYYDKIAPQQIAQASHKFGIEQHMKKIPDKKILASIAANLSADIVFVIQIKEIQSVFRTQLFDGDSLEDTYVHLVSALYLAKQDRYILTEGIASELVEPAVDTGAVKMTGQCMDIIIKKIDPYLTANK